MRKINMYSAVLLTTLVFCVHAILSDVGFLLGVYTLQPRFALVLLRAVFCVHIVLSVILSISAIRAGIKGSFHARANKSYWIKRITAVLILVFSCIHFSGVIFSVHPVIMTLFDISFMLSILVHAGIGAKAVLIKSGAANAGKAYRCILAVMIAFAVIFAALEVCVLLRRLP